MAQRKAAPQIGLVMGSDSDWDVMKHAAAQLEAFGIAYEARVLSAHRMPDEMFEYAEDAAPARPARDHRRRRRRGAPARHARREDDGARARRAGAVEISARRGFAAVDRADADRHPGRDFAIGEAGAANAALFAVAMLAATDPAVARKLTAFRQKQTTTARAKHVPPAA